MSQYLCIFIKRAINEWVVGPRQQDCEHNTPREVRADTELTAHSAFFDGLPRGPEGECLFTVCQAHLDKKTGRRSLLSRSASPAERLHALAGDTRGGDDGAITERRRLRRHRAWRTQTHSEDLQPQADRLCPHQCTSKKLVSLWVEEGQWGCLRATLTGLYATCGQKTGCSGWSTLTETTSTLNSVFWV